MEFYNIGFSSSNSSSWQAKLKMNKTLKYTSILWAYSDYEVKVITDKGGYQFYHELTVPGLHLQEVNRTDARQYYKASKYDSADVEAIEM